ncbi:MAG: ABC transporter permease, partial [Cyclobacteriaceae bacterium]|nr:ABC transporter permease [Cyclobacteriaceae bacterium]
MVTTWLTLSFRRFRRHPVNSLINLFGLTLGLTVFLLIFIYVRHEFSYDNFHRDADRVFRLLKETPPGPGDYMGNNKQAVLPAPLYDVIKKDIAGVEAVSRMGRWNRVTVETEGKAFFEEYLYGADPEFFKLLTFEILPGAPASVLERPYTVAIAEDVALRYFGTTDAVGKVLDFTGFIPFGRYTVDAVFRTFPTNSSYQFNIILRFTDIVKVVQPTDLENWGNNNYHYWVKTSAGTDPHQVEDQVHAFYANKYKDASDDRDGQSTFPLEPLREIYVRAKSDVNFSSAPSNDINRLYMLATTAVLVLLIAGINYVNLTTARAVSRAREVGVRKVSGANHLNLIAQFMTDTMMVTLISAAVAVAATWSLMPWFRAFLGKDIPFDLFRDPSSVLLFTTITLVIGLLAGLYPAVVLSSFLPARVLKGTFARSSEGATLRSGLTVFQFTISGALIMGVLIIGQQLRFIERHNPGYDREQIITVSLLDEGVRNKRDVLIEELKKHPGVINVTFASYLPNAVNTQQSRIWKSAEGSFEVSFYTTHVDHNYLDVFGITLVEGRNFQPDLPGDRNAFIINETAAKAYGWEHPVGMQFTGERTGQPGDTVTIIGVMKDFHFVNYRLPIKPLRFGLNRNWSSQLAVKVHPDRIPEVLSHLEANYRKLATTRMPYAYNFFDEQFGNAYKSDRQLGVLTSVFCVIAVLIACLGLYGLSLDAVTQRLREVGVRKVFGASLVQIMRLLSHRFVSMI